MALKEVHIDKQLSTSILNNLPPARPDILDLPKFKPPTYQDTFLKDMAEDIKQPMERQISAIEEIAQSAKVQAESLIQLLKVLKSKLKKQ